MRYMGGQLKTQAFMRLSIGMTKQEVINTISEPDIVRGSILNEDNKMTEVWEYNEI